MIARRQPIPRRRSNPRRTSVERDPKYLDWIRGCCCLLLGSDCIGKAEAAHIGPHGLSQKASDHETLPLCLAHHAELHRLGKPFWDRYRIDRDRLIAHYRELYAAEGRSRPTAYLEGMAGGDACQNRRQPI